MSNNHQVKKCGCEFKQDESGGYIVLCEEHVNSPTLSGSPTPDNMEEKSANYVQVGEITACGHCDERFVEGLKQAKVVGFFKCDCRCHKSDNMECKHFPNGEQYCNCPPTKSLKGWDWETEFDKKFPLELQSLCSRTMPYENCHQDCSQRIKSFIRDLVSKVQSEAYKEGRDDYWKELSQTGAYLIARQSTLQEILDEIGKMKINNTEIANRFGAKEYLEKQRIYNSALSDLEKIIEKMKCQ